MASSVEKSSCITCSKAAGLVTCRGCAKNFCIPHVIEHRQTLSKMMDEITVDHDQLRQTITERKTEHRHPLIKQIDEWEQKSIDKIRQTADDARQQLMTTVGKNISLVTESLRQLKQQLTEAREKEEYLETDLEEWKKKLDELKNLTESRTIRIRSDDNVTQFISKITVGGPVSADFFERPTGNIRIDDKRQLIAQGPTNQYAAVRGRGQYSGGQYWFRFKLVQMHSAYMFFGIISKDAPMQPQSCSTPTSYGWGGQGYVYINGVHHPNFNGYTGDMQTGDIMELMVDCNQRMIRITNERTRIAYELKVDLIGCPFPWQLNVTSWYANDCVRILSE